MVLDISISSRGRSNGVAQDDESASFRNLSVMECRRAAIAQNGNVNAPSKCADDTAFRKLVDYVI